MSIHMYYDRADSVESVTLRFEINEEYVIDNSVNYPDITELKLNDGEYELLSITECMESVNKSYVKDGLSRFDVEVGDSIENEQKIQEIYRKTRVLPILSDPTSVDSDGDGFEDKSDERPLISDTITVNLPNVYDIDYLNIDGNSDGGNQYWWGVYPKR